MIPVINIVSHSHEGDIFLAGMDSIEKKWRIAREAFIRFLNASDIQAFHIHDGHVKRPSGYYYASNADALTYDKLLLAWIPDHIGYSFLGFVNRGDKIAIIKDSPTGKQEIFKVWVYECYDIKYNLFCEKFLSFIETKEVKFDGTKYEWYTKQSLLSRLLKFFKP